MVTRFSSASLPALSAAFILSISEAVPQINYRILLYIKTMTVNQQKSELHDIPRGNMNKNLNT
jgi:hypothetical protein